MTVFHFFKAFLIRSCDLNTILAAFKKQIVNLRVSVILQTPKMAIAMLCQDWYARGGWLIHRRLNKLVEVLKMTFFIKYFREGNCYSNTIEMCSSVCPTDNMVLLN